MFAIVDIETCGAKFSFQKGRIIDICIVIHDGLQVIDKFSTLINPECYISGFYTNISGITNEMVQDAPKFHEVAKEILSFTEGKIFVAHNVSFDYNFVKEEFASLGFKFKRDTLCTVKMSRKLIPGKKSYSLGNLCESLGITNIARHRAEGDALATTELLDYLLQLKAQQPAFRSKTLYQMMSTKTEAIKKYVLDKLPDSCGVYYFLNQQDQIIYIGKSVNMYSRALSHYNSDLKKTKSMLYELHHVDFIETGSELISLLLEAIEIKKHQPFYNKKSKGAVFTHGIAYFSDEAGIVNISLQPYSETQPYLLSFTHYASGRERLEHFIEKFELCQAYAGLSDSQPCFRYQIKSCRGICNQEEEISIYNERVSELIQLYTYPWPNFMILEPGRTPEEKAFIWIHEYKYAGYGYLDESVQIDSSKELSGYLESNIYYPDADAIIRSYMKQKKCRLVNFNQ